MRYLLALLASILLGCASTPPLVYRMDPSVEPYAEMLLDGASAWAPMGVTLTVDDSAARVIRCDNIPGALGITDDTGIRINCDFMGRDLDPRYATPETSAQRLRIKRQVFIHEFGHFLGLQHVEDREAVMYPDMFGTLTFDKSDLEEFDRAFVDR